MNNTFGIKGVEDHCYFLKSVDDAHRLRVHIRCGGVSEYVQAREELGSRFLGARCSCFARVCGCVCLWFCDHFLWRVWGLSQALGRVATNLEGLGAGQGGT